MLPFESTRSTRLIVPRPKPSSGFDCPEALCFRYRTATELSVRTMTSEARAPLGGSVIQSRSFPVVEARLPGTNEK